MKGLKRKIYFEPGYDCLRYECTDRSGKKDCHGDHGSHGMQMRFVVGGEEGAVQFLLFTHWLPGVAPRYDDTPWGNPMAADLGYHSKKPHYKGQEKMQDDCPYIKGPCYYDGSGLNAEQPWSILRNYGDAALWKFLEGYYLYVFRKAEYPEVKAYDRKRRAVAVDPRSFV